MRELAGNVGIEFLFRNALENLEVGIAGALGVRYCGYIFAEVIEAGEHPGCVARAGGGKGFVERFARNKAMRHAARRRIRRDPVGEALAFGQLQQRGAEHACSIMPALRAPI